jgi:hypothetical protein
MADPQSTDEWLRLVRQHERVARIICDDKIAASQAHWHAGIAIECALKAYIMHVQRFNGWPSKESRPDLYTHDLRELLKISGISLRSSDPVAPAWALVLQWDRNQGYEPKPMPRKVARSFLDAAFGQNGVVTWIRFSLKTDIGGPEQITCARSSGLV